MYGCLHSPRSLPQGLLLDLALAFTPRVEPEGPLTVLLDLRGLGRMWPSPEALGQALHEAGRERGHDLQVALAGTRTAALLLGRARPGLTVVPLGREAAAMAPLPLAALGLPPEREDLFRRWGLTTVGALGALPALGLAERLGPDGPRLRRQALGEDDVPLLALAAPESFACTLEVDWPVDGLEPLAFLLARVLEPLGQALVSRCRRAAALTLELGLVDGRTHRRTLRPSAPSAEPRTWRTLLLLDLEAHPPDDAVLVLTVRAEPTPARPVQFSLLDPAQPSPERLAETMARLTEWTAEGRGGAPALLDSHRPGAFVMETFAPGPFRSRGEGGAAPRVALRAFRPPRPAEVTLRAGEPAFVSAPGVRGAVAERAGPWRASGDWWDAAWSREEWDVALQGGGVYRIFHDRMREAWFVEGELD